MVDTTVSLLDMATGVYHEFDPDGTKSMDH